MPVTAALITAGVTAATSLGTSAYQNYKAKKIARENVRPVYTPSQQIEDNAKLAASYADTGLSDASKTLYNQENERNLSQSLNSILRAGGSPNQISDLYANNNDAMLKLASMDSDLQYRNLQNYINANRERAGEYQTAWNVNQYGPYADKAQLAALLRQNSVQNLNQGINQINNGIANYGTSTLFKNNIADLQKQIDLLSKGQNIYTPGAYGPVGPVNPSNAYLDSRINSQLNNDSNDSMGQYDNSLYNEKYGQF